MPSRTSSRSAGGSGSPMTAVLLSIRHAPAAPPMKVAGNIPVG